MRIQRDRPTALTVTLHPMELASLVTAARWVTEGAQGQLPEDAIDQLRQVLASYDQEVARLPAG